MPATTEPGVLDAIDNAAAAAGVRVLLHARDLRSGRELGVGSDTPVVLASVFKVPVAVELANQFEAGVLHPTQRVVVPATGRTSGGTGLSALVDPVEMSLRDVAQLMISVSDNAATDIVVDRVGRDNVNSTMRQLGLEQTVLEGDCAFLLGRLVDDLQLNDQERARFAGTEAEEQGERWRSPLQANAGVGEAPHRARQRADEDEVFTKIEPARWQRCRDLQAEMTNRSTPREMVRLLELIWKDEAGPPEACAFVRRIMGQQVWPHRLRAGFPGGVKTSGKTGTLPFIRNEAGVVEYPDGAAYAVAVFTVAQSPALLLPDADRVIGTVARLAVDALRTARS
jgi:beta-lactamase class A